MEYYSSRPFWIAPIPLISRVLVLTDSYDRAIRLVKGLGLEKVANENPIKFEIANGMFANLDVSIVTNSAFSESCPMVLMSLLTTFSIKTLNPDLIILAGTVKIYNSKHYQIGDQLLASSVVYRDLAEAAAFRKGRKGDITHTALYTPKLLANPGFQVARLYAGFTDDPADELSVYDGESVAAVAYAASLVHARTIFLMLVDGLAENVVENDKEMKALVEDGEFMREYEKEYPEEFKEDKEPLVDYMAEFEEDKKPLLEYPAEFEEEKLPMLDAVIKILNFINAE